MPRSSKLSFQESFAKLTDPRVRPVLYPLINVVTIAICGVLCGCDDFVSIAAFGRSRRDWLSKFLDLSAGIPSHDRFNAIFRRLNVVEFQECLLDLIMGLHEVTEGQVIAVDGKTLRRSFDKASGKSAIHMVSAWASANHITLGHVVVDEKSNEITAIPKLLKMLELSGSLVTIDAMGCQVEIARTIVEADADYVLAVKDNQPTLSAGIEEFFVNHVEDDFAQVESRKHITKQKGHGREERREYVICPVPENLPDRKRWPKLAAIAMVFSYTIRNGKEQLEARHYILSKYISAKRFAEAVRAHWSIENRCHWQLDVSFQEDQSRTRKDNAQENFSGLRRTALSLLKNNTTQKVGIKNRRLIAAFDPAYLQELLFGK
jgi:predicted transposase YbfD/YdcC